MHLACFLMISLSEYEGQGLFDSVSSPTLLANVINAFRHYQVRFQNWPWRLLSGHHMESTDRDALHDAFFNEHPCCLDQWFSRWLRLTLHAADDLNSEANKLLVATLARKVPMTNMTLEGLLAEIKASVAYSKWKPSVEKVSHLGLLTQLRREHCAAGFPDALCTKRADLVQAGVPLRARRASGGSVRLDNTWRNLTYSSWTASHPESTPEGRLAKRLEIRAQWRNMSDEERAAAVAPLQGEPVDETSLDPEIECQRQQGASEWRDGGSGYPISEETLISFLGIDALQVIAGNMPQKRWDAWNEIFVKDSGLVPDALKL